MEPVRGFPLITGLRLSAPPAAFGGKLYLSDEEAFVHEIDTNAVRTRWETAFPAALRSPPSFFTMGDKSYAAVYPKSFLGGIWLLGADGKVLPNWPAPVSGIAFGSPLLFSADTAQGASKKNTRNGRLLAAFISQAGELSVYDENAALLPAFPLELPGIFFIQPVFDGEFLWFVSAEGTLFQVNLGGQILRQEIPGLTVKEEGYITVVDTDGDKIPEIFFSGEGNALFGYKRNFMSLDGFPLPIWGKPALADLNGDGRLEITGAGLDNRIYRWQFR
jgi:hypothetical protein